MGLKVIDGLKRERKPVLEVDISAWTGTKDVLRFSEPRAADMFPNWDQKRELKIAFPEFPYEMIDQIILLGKTYVLDETDEEVNPIRSFAQLARNHRDVFVHVLAAHFEAFQRADVDSGVVAAKNDSSE
jgi:hypothetical protein